MATTVQTSKVIFEAEDKTAAGVAAVKATLETTEVQAKKTTKAIEGSGKALKGTGSAAAQAAKEVGSSLDVAHAKVKGFSATGEKFQQIGENMRKGLFPATAALAALTAGIAAAGAVAAKQKEAETIGDHLQVSIDGASQALGGYLTEVQIATLANKAFYAGVATNGQELAKLSAGVATLARDRGRDVSEVMTETIDAIKNRDEAALQTMGIFLSQSDAESQYAAALGKTVDTLTAYERAQAFSKIAVEKFAQTQRESVKANDSFSESWDKASYSLDNMGSRMLGFVNSGGGIRETLRGIDEDILKLVGSERLGDVRRVEAAFEAAGMSADTLQKYVIETNNIEEVGGLTASNGAAVAARRLMIQEGMRDLAQEALRFQDQEIRKSEYLAEIAAKEAQVKADADANSALDHEVALLQAVGAEENKIVEAQTRALELRIAQAEAAGDLVSKVESERKLELLLVAAYSKKKKASGGGSGPTRADRERAAGERLLAQLDQEIERVRLLAEIRGTSEESSLGIAREERAYKLAQLDMEERVLGLTKAKNAVDRENQAAKLEAIAAKRVVIELEAQQDAQDAVNRLIATAVALSTERATQEGKAAERAAEKASLGYDEAEALSQSQTEIALRSERNVLRRLDIEREGQLELAALARDRLANEDKAEKAALDARQAALDSQSGGTELEQLQRQEAYKQLAHDRDLQRLDTEAQARRLLEQEKQAAFEADKARSKATWGLVEESLGQFEQFRGQVTELTSFFSERSTANADADHAQYINSLNERGAAQQASLDRQLAAAEGNAALTAKLNKRKEANERNLRRQIELAEAKHQDKRKRQEMRAAGAQLLIQAAVEAVRAAISFASYDFVGGALHTGAAIFAGIQGAALISGNIPGGGAQGNLSSGGGSGMSAGATTESLDPSNVPGSTPGTAARREAATPRTGIGQGGGGTTVVINGSINAWGSIDSTVLEDLARGIDQVSRSKEK